MMQEPTQSSLINYLFGSDMIPTQPATYSYREPTYSVTSRLFDDMVDKQFRDFDDFFMGESTRLMPFRLPSSTSIDIDIKEDPKEYLLSADVPGVKKQDIQITITQGILEISAERQTKGSSTSDDGKYRRQERSYGKISRSLQLPDGIDEDRIKAQYQDGVISLSIPKKPDVKEKPKVKKIDIASTKADSITNKAVVSGLEPEFQTSVAAESSSSGLIISEDDKLPTDGPAQEKQNNEPTLVHSSYA